MNEEIYNLKIKAEEYRHLYRMGQITREEAMIEIKPYLDKVNEKSKEIATKYNQKVKKVTFSSFVR